MSQEPRTIRARIQYDSKGPAYTATVTDADTGAPIEGAFRVLIDANSYASIPKVEIHAYRPVIDVTTEARVYEVCACCRRDLDAAQEEEEQEPA